MANPLLKDLFSFLTRDPNITALIGLRCHPTNLPQAPTFPALSYAQIDATRVRELEGPAGKVRRRVSISSWARNSIGVWVLADTVRVALDGFAGMMGDTEIGSVILENEIPFFEEQAGTVGIHRVMQDYQLAHIET
jgi:hypothetical protein